MSPYRTERLFQLAIGACTVLAVAVLALIVVFLIAESAPAWHALGLRRFFSDTAWHPTEDHFGLWPMIVGSLLVTAGALLLAGPLGIISALFSTHYAPPAAGRIYQQMIAVLAGVPSVVYGLWGLVVLVPLIGRIAAPGTSLLAGILVLALMVLPTVALLTDASIRSVSRETISAAAALGLGRWAILRRVVLPTARPGILSALFLAAARAIGETMAVLMVCGNVTSLPSSVFDPVRTLTANIALEMAYAMDLHRSALFVSGLVLVGVVLLLVAAAEFSARRQHA